MSFQRFRRRAAGRGRAPIPETVFGQGWDVIHPPYPIDPSYPRTKWLNGQLVDLSRFPLLSQFLEKWIPRAAPLPGDGDVSIVDGNDGSNYPIIS